MHMRKSFGEKCFDLFNILFMILICIAVIVPIMHVLAGSLSSTNALTHAQVGIWPIEFNLDNYQVVMNNKVFWNAFKITTIVVVVGTSLNMILTILAAYPLSKRYLKGRTFFILFILFTMIFSAPMIPNFLVVKSLGLLNTIWALILPSAVNAFNLILCITFFRTSIPEELFEAAKIDGMTEYGIVWRIAVPLSKPILMTLMLFYAVQHWNSYIHALLYITDQRLRPLQLYLYNLLQQGNINEAMTGTIDVIVDVSPQGIQMATIVVATVPVVLIYPFIQKHFIRGALLGSLKE